MYIDCKDYTHKIFFLPHHTFNDKRKQGRPNYESSKNIASKIRLLATVKISHL